MAVSRKKYSKYDVFVITEYLRCKLTQFSRGVDTSRLMVRSDDCERHRNQLRYYVNCESCVKKMLDDLSRVVVTEEAESHGS